MKKSTKIIIAIIVVTLLALAFFGVYKYGMKKAEIAQISDTAQDQNESVTDKVSERNGAQDKASSIGSQSPQLKVVNSIGGTNPTTARILTSAEERENCKKWQMARNASGVKPAMVINGLCIPEAMGVALYQEYLATHDQINIASTSQTATPATPSQTQYSMETYTSSQFGFSFKYPAGMICEQKNDGARYQIVGGATGPFDYYKYRIDCGEKNLDGGRANSNGGVVWVYADNGQSQLRSNLRSQSTESGSKTVNGNKFYFSGDIGWTTERPKYLFSASSIDQGVTSSKIDISSLRF